MSISPVWTRWGCRPWVVCSPSFALTCCAGLLWIEPVGFIGNYGNVTLLASPPRRIRDTSGPNRSYFSAGPSSIYMQEPPVKHPSSEPARERRVNPGTSPRVGLFSHSPEAAVSEQHRPPVSEGVDWQTIPFSHGIAEQRRTGGPRLTHGPRRQPADRTGVTTTPARPALP